MLLSKSRGLPGDPIDRWLLDGRTAGFRRRRTERLVVQARRSAAAERDRPRPLRRPVNPHGNDRIPYLIRDHIHSDKWGVPNAVAEATTVTWPSDEPATVVKFDIFRKKVSVYTATVLDGNQLFVDFPNCICRNKMVVQIDRPEQCYLLPSSEKEGAFRSWWGSWGCHQVAFYGNLANRSGSLPR